MIRINRGFLFMLACVLFIFPGISILWQRADAEVKSITRTYNVAGLNANFGVGVPISVQWVYRCSGSACPDIDLGEGIVESDHEDFYCHAEAPPVGEGIVVYALYRGTSGLPQTSGGWPSTFTCEHTITGGDTYRLVVTVADDPFNGWENADDFWVENWNTTGGFFFEFHQSGNLKEVSGLKAGPAPYNNMVSDCWDAYKGGQLWTGVKCCAKDRPNLGDSVGVAVGPGADEGSGTCNAQRTSGGSVPIPIDVERYY